MTQNMDETWTKCIADKIPLIESHLMRILKSSNPELEEMCHYVIGAGGKRIRPLICILSHLACEGDKIDRAISIGSAFEIVHSASLIHDDINDNGEMRRGRKTLHKQYSLTKAIVAGDFMMVKGYRSLGNVDDQIMHIIDKAASMMSESEFMQNDFERVVTVTEENYTNIIRGKTAMLINASAMAGAYLAKAEHNYLEAIDIYSTNVGLAFQIVDDILDVVGISNNLGKMPGTDLIEGKPTLPLIYALMDKEYGPKISGIYKNSNASDEDIKEALECIKKTNALDKSMKLAEKYIDEAIVAIEVLPNTQYKDSLIGLAKYIVSRNR